MATQTRVPGAASSEVDFELERFERTAEDRIEISGRWFGLRGRRFVRPVLNLNAGGSRRRAIALLEHKPWAADDGQTWLAAFRWPEGAGEISGAELEVGPGLVVDLPAPGGKPGSAVRVSALRPHVPAVQPNWRSHEEGGDADSATPVADSAAEPRAPRSHADRSGTASAPDRTDAPRHPAGPSGRAAAPDWTAAPRHPAGPSGRAAAPDWTAAPRHRAGPSGRAAAPDWTAAPRRESAAPGWTAAPPRDVLTAALAERDEAVAARDQAEQERVTALTDRDDALSRRDAALRDVDRAAAERDEAFAERDRLTGELERVTRERDIAHAERSRTLRDTEAVERDRDQAAAERDAARSELARAIPAREEAIRERDAEAARAEQAESERETAFVERKSAVAQRDRARRERDRAMRSAGVEPPEESPYIATARADRGDAEQRVPDATEAEAAEDASPADAAPPGTPLPSRPVKRIGTAPAGPAPEPKPLLTPVDAGRPRRLSRTRRTPSAPARWAVRLVVLLLLIAIAVVLVMLLARAV